MPAETLTLDFALMSCGECGVVFKFPEGLRRELEVTKRTWYCPNGHQRVYRESTEDRLRKQLAAKEAELDRTRAFARDLEAGIKKVEASRDRLKRRVSAGCCPYCKRNFRQLRVHVKKCHPSETKETTV